MWTLSGGEVGVQLLEGVGGLTGECRFGEVEGVLLETDLVGEGEVFFDFLESMSKLMSNRLDTELLSEYASLSNPLLPAVSLFLLYFSSIDGDNMDDDCTKDIGIGGCFTSPFRLPLPPEPLRPLLDGVV